MGMRYVGIFNNSFIANLIENLVSEKHFIIG